jgi:hypothetical protein
MNVKDLLKRIRVPFLSEIIIQVIAAKGFNMNVKMTTSESSNSVPLYSLLVLELKRLDKLLINNMVLTDFTSCQWLLLVIVSANLTAYS